MKLTVRVTEVKLDRRIRLVYPPLLESALNLMNVGVAANVRQYL